MSASVQDIAINALSTCDFAVETFGDRYTVAYGGEIVLRQASRRDFLIFANGVAAGFFSCEQMAARRASLETQLAQSPAHQAALEGKDK